MGVISIGFSKHGLHSIFAVQPASYGLHVDYKVGETWLDCYTQRVEISVLKSSWFLGTSDLPEGLSVGLLLLLSVPHQ